MSFRTNVNLTLESVNPYRRYDDKLEIHIFEFLFMSKFYTISILHESPYKIWRNPLGLNREKSMDIELMPQ